MFIGVFFFFKTVNTSFKSNNIKDMLSHALINAKTLIKLQIYIYIEKIVTGQFMKMVRKFDYGQ